MNLGGIAFALVIHFVRRHVSDSGVSIHFAAGAQRLGRFVGDAGEYLRISVQFPQAPGRFPGSILH